MVWVKAKPSASHSSPKRETVVSNGNVKCECTQPNDPSLYPGLERCCSLDVTYVHQENGKVWLTVGTHGSFAFYNLTINVWIWNTNTLKWQLKENLPFHCTLQLTYSFLVSSQLFQVHWVCHWNTKILTEINIQEALKAMRP